MPGTACDYVGNGGGFKDRLVTAGEQVARGDKSRPPAPNAGPAAASRNPGSATTASDHRTFDLSADGMLAFDSSTLTGVGKSRVDNLIKALRAGGLKLTSVKIVGHITRCVQGHTTKSGQRHASDTQTHLLSLWLATSHH